MKIKWLDGPMEVLGVGLMNTDGEYEVSDKIGGDLISEGKAQPVSESPRTRKPFKVSDDGPPQDSEEGDG